MAGVFLKVGASLRQRIPLAGLLVAASLLAGCASRPGPDTLLPSAATAPGAKTVEILVASTRARDAREGTFFNGERAPLSFATVDLSVPPTHQPGQIEWPKTPPGNPETDMVVRDAVYRDTAHQFVADLNAELAKRPKGQRKAIVFIHGYNTQFSEALYRLGQLAADSDSNAVPVLFTWASRAKSEGYVYDNNSATVARDSLEETLRLVFASNAEEVTILAHSMGNWVTVEALRQIRISGKGVPINKVGNVILAAPDIDIDVFKSQLRRFGKPAKPFVVIVSHDDKALGLSSFLAGGKTRLGDYQNDQELTDLGAVVIDMTNVKALDDFNHGKFAQLANIAPELRAAIAQGAAGNQGTAPATVETQGIKIVGLDRVGKALRKLGTAQAGELSQPPAPSAPAAPQAAPAQ